MKLSSYLLIFATVLCILLTTIVDHCNGQSSSSDNTNGGGADEESSETKEMEAFMKLIMKSSQKHLKRMLETVDIGLITGTKCNSSWHQFMTDNQLSPERFSTILDEYKSGNHEKIIKLVRPEQCLTSENGKFCQVDHLTNITSRSKARVFDVTYALCYPRGCSTDELNKIMSTITESYKGMATIQMKLKIVKCTTSMGEVTQMEIDTAQKLFKKMTTSGSVDQTLEMSKFKYPGSKGVPVGVGLGGGGGLEPSFPTQPFPILANLPNFQFNLPEDVPNFSKQFTTSAPPLATSTSASSPSLAISLKPSTTVSTTSFLSSPISTNSFATITKSASSTTISSTESSIEKPLPPVTVSYHPAFKWPETSSLSDEISDGTNPLLYSDILYSNPDITPESSSSSFSSPTSNPLDISKFNETLLRKMIPGLLVQGD